MGREVKRHYQGRVVRSTPGIRHPDFRTVLSTWRLCGSPAFGVALYMTTITAASIAVLVYIVRYLARSGDSRRTCLLVYGFFYLFLFVPIYAMAMVKDAVFLPCFLLFSV